LSQKRRFLPIFWRKYLKNHSIGPTLGQTVNFIFPELANQGLGFGLVGCVAGLPDFS
jgi:hypothetical protein